MAVAPVDANASMYENVINFVGGRQQSLIEFSQQTTSWAETALANLAAFTVDFTPLAPPAPPPPGGPATFVMPTAVSPNIGAFVAPDPPNALSVPTRNLQNTAGSAPSEPGAIATGLKYTEPGLPSQQQAPEADYGPAPVLADVDFDDITPPDQQVIPLPDFLNLPDFDENLNLPNFDGVRPVRDFEVPNTPFFFTEVPYTSGLLEKIKSRIEVIMDGGNGLPAAIEQAIYDRARVREDETAARALQEADVEWSSRGFQQPPGMLARQRRMIRQNNQNQTNQLSRDVRIEAVKTQIDMLKTALAQGIALEQALIGLHLAVEERRFQAARFAYEAVLQVLNARIALHNAEVEAYRIDSQVWRDLIGALVDEYKAKSDRQRTVAEINKAMADLYEAQQRGQLAEIEAYAAQINARRAKLEGQRLHLDLWRTKIQAFGEKISAYRAVWEAYSAQVQGRLGKVQAAGIAAGAYRDTVSAWSQKRQADIAKLNAELEKDRLDVQVHDGNVRMYLGLLQKESSRMSAEAQAKQAQASVMQANAAVRATEADVINRGLQLVIERYRTEADHYLKTGEINLQTLVQTLSLMRESLGQIAQITGQLAASTLSAFNLSGGLSGSASNSSGVNFNYSGEI